MKFTVNSEQLKTVLSKLIPVLGSNTVLPILDCFLFDIENDKLTITASDLETFALESISVNCDNKISFAIPARILTETLKQLPNQKLTFIYNDNSVTVETISGAYVFATEESRDYPKMPEMSETVFLNIDTNKLIIGIEKTIFALSTDTLRPALTGVCLDLQGNKLSFVATDAHRLSIVTYNENTTIEGQYILAKKCLQVLKSSLNYDNVSISFSDTNVFFNFADTTIISRIIDAKYPHYAAIIPTGFNHTIEVNRIELINSLKRVSNFAEKTTNQVRLDFKQNLITVTAENIDKSNKAKETIGCTLSGAELQMGFNIKFFIEALQNLNAQFVKIEIVSNTKAAIITDGSEAKMLVMPIIIN
jgi:DNA polymerase-3 subunit beta